MPRLTIRWVSAPVYRRRRRLMPHSPQTYAASIAEAANATDSTNAAAVFANSFTESGSATDSTGALAVFVSFLTETGAANDSGNAIGAFGCAIIEAASATDTEDGTPSHNYTANVTEAASANDNIAVSYVPRDTGGGRPPNPRDLARLEEERRKRAQEEKEEARREAERAAELQGIVDRRGVPKIVVEAEEAAAAALLLLVA